MLAHAVSGFCLYTVAMLALTTHALVIKAVGMLFSEEVDGYECSRVGACQGSKSIVLDICRGHMACFQSEEINK